MYTEDVEIALGVPQALIVVALLARINRNVRDLVSFFRNASTVRVKHGMITDALFPRSQATDG